MNALELRQLLRSNKTLKEKLDMINNSKDSLIEDIDSFDDLKFLFYDNPSDTSSRISDDDATKAVFIAKKAKLPELILRASDFFHFTFNMDEGLRKICYEALKGHFSNMIRDRNDFNLIIRNLTPEQCKEVCEVFKDKLPKLFPKLSDVTTSNPDKAEIIRIATIQARLEKYKNRIENYTSDPKTSPRSAVNQTAEQSKDIELRSKTSVTGKDDKDDFFNFGRGLWFSTATRMENRRLSYQLATALLTALPNCTTIQAVQEEIEKLKIQHPSINSSELRSIIEDVQSIPVTGLKR